MQQASSCRQQNMAASRLQPVTRLGLREAWGYSQTLAASTLRRRLLPSAAVATAGTQGVGTSAAATGSSSSRSSSSKALAKAGGGQQAGGARTLMIVESPTKASKIQKFLGDDFKVVASYGHVRDLVNKTGAVKPEQGFDMVWQVPAAADVRLREMAAASAGCRALVLATDPDREGEAISWHITQELKRRGVLSRPGLTLQRVTFTEVTQKAVKEALQQPRQVSAALVDAYLARRALDHLVGFSLSPLVWRRLSPAARSAGRVQSVALRLVCEREDARQLFTPEEFWTLAADFSPNPAAAAIPPAAAAAGEAAATPPSSSSGTTDAFQARLVQVDGQKLAKFAVSNKEQSDALVARLWQQQQQQQKQQLQEQLQAQQDVWYTVSDVASRPVRRNPPPPLVTSTLQQEAGRRLRFSSSKTMQVAQQLYEGANTGEGLITYMRTDGVNLAPAAVEELRQVIVGRYGQQYLPASGPRVYKSRAKNAQEAHEAIRPTDPSLLPEQAAAQLTPDQARLYDLIWRRAVGSQMEAAELEQVTVDLLSPCGGLLLRATGSSLSFPGFQAAWQLKGLAAQEQLSGAADSDGEEGAAAADGDDSDDSGSSMFNDVLRQLRPGQLVKLVQVLPRQHFTEPPPRFSEASMVKTLEELGVGRPSTYAPILSLLKARGYVGSRHGRSLVPTPLGRLLTAYLTEYFPEYVDVNFTARVEEQLDEVSAGSLPWKQLMAGFWEPLEAAVSTAAKSSTTQVFDKLDKKLDHLIFQQPPAATTEAQAAASTAADDAAAGGGGRAAADPRVCPACGGRLVLKPSKVSGAFIACSNHATNGCRFGRPLWPDADELLQLSDEEEDVAAAAAAAAASGDPADDGSGQGVIGSSKLLGRQPGTDVPVWVKRGPYGLYVQLGDDPAADNGSNGSSSKASRPLRVSLPSGSWASLTLEQALQLLAPPRVVGPHPDTGEPILASSWRYGPYVRHKTLFVTLPQALSPADVSLEQALQLIQAKEQRLRARGRDPYAVKAKPAKPGRAKKADKGSSGVSGTRRLSGYQLFLREGKAASHDGSASSAQLASSGEAVSSKKPGTHLQQLAAAWRELPDAEKTAFNSRASEMAAAVSEAADVEAKPSSSSSSSKKPQSTAKPRTAGSSSSSSASSRRKVRDASTAAAAPSTQAAAAAAAAAREGSASSSSTSVGAAVHGNGNGNGNSTAARLSGFNLFVRDMAGRPLLPEPQPVPAAAAGRSRSRSKAPSRMQLLAAAWKALPESDRQGYEARARD